MNKIEATIKNIQKADSVHLTSLDFKGNKLNMLSLELHENLNIGKRVLVTVKATHISIAKTFIKNISCSNQFLVSVNTIKEGKLISIVKLDFHGVNMESLITTNDLKEIDIKVGDEVVMLMESSEISILEILDD